MSDTVHWMYRTLVPAYGRDYRTAEEAEQAFRAGKDFSVVDGSGPYASIRDYPPGTQVTLRFAKRRKVALVTV